MSIGKIILLLREQQDISQKELADKIDISYSVMNRIESGERPTREKEILLIAKALNVSPNYLLGVTEEFNRNHTNIHEIPKIFDNPNKAREYVNQHQIFESIGLDTDKLDDDEIVQFANELLEQMKMVSYKYRR